MPSEPVLLETDEPAVADLLEFGRPDPSTGPAGPRAPLRPAPLRRTVRGPVYRGLPAPIRVAAWAAFAIAIGIIAGATAPRALREVGAVAYSAPSMLAWYSVRATGFLAFFAIAGSVAYGLMLSTKLLDIIAHRPVTFALHKDLALVGLGLATLHGVLLLADHTFAFTPVALLVPFRSPYAPLAVGIGQIGFYLVALVTGSFYVRRQIGQRAWRLIHYLTLLSFVGVAAHGITSGSDTPAAWAFWAYLVPVAIVVFLFVYRIVTAISAGMDRRVAARVAAALAADDAGGQVAVRPGPTLVDRPIAEIEQLRPLTPGPLVRYDPTGRHAPFTHPRVSASGPGFTTRPAEPYGD